MSGACDARAALPLLVVDDHTVLSEALAEALRRSGFEQARALPATSLDADAIVEAAGAARGLVLLDLNLGRVCGSSLIAPLRSVGATVIVLTAVDDPLALARCMDAGAEAVLDKSTSFDEIVEAASRVAEGMPAVPASQRAQLLADLDRERQRAERFREPFTHLTPREREVLTLLVDGYTAEEISALNRVRITTVRSQIRSILAKLGSHSQLGAVAYARRAGFGGEGSVTPSHQF